jgi:hypothetical protein
MVSMGFVGEGRACERELLRKSKLKELLCVTSSTT